MQWVTDIVGITGLVVLLWGAFSVGIEIGSMVCGVLIIGWALHKTVVQQ